MLGASSSNRSKHYRQAGRVFKTAKRYVHGVRRNMVSPSPGRSPPLKSALGTHENTILVLQGGGALGAYQAGVYAGMARCAALPNWVVGVSIGAINSALIAGNPVERRVERLREFWERVSLTAPVHCGSDLFRPIANRMSAAHAIMFGIPGFFLPRGIPPWCAPDGSAGALSFYDTSPLRATLEELVDFDRINRGDIRLSLGAVNVRTGRSIYFDSRETEITPAHVLASGALPPGFPPVEVDGELYWDGGIVSNTPLQYVLEEFRINALIFQVDVFSGPGEAPRNLSHALERAKDIQYASKQRLSTERIREIEEMRTVLARVIGKLPADLRSDPDVERLTLISRRGALSLVRLVNHHDTGSLDFKDYEFSRDTVDDLWRGGFGDLLRSLSDPAACAITDFGNDARCYELIE